MAHKIIQIGRHVCKILHVELKYFHSQLRIGLYLDVIGAGINDLNGKPIPLTSSWGAGGFKDEKKSIKDMGFTDPKSIAKQYKFEYVHLFILNNVLHGRGTTPQLQYQQNFIKELLLQIGLDLSKVNESNIDKYNEALNKLLVGKFLEADWHQWWDPNGWKKPYAGPGGDNMLIREERIAA